MGYELIKTPVLPIKNQEDILHVSLESVLAYPMLKNDDFFFVQIGAFDGISFDPIYPFIRKYGWWGILLEPQKDSFDRLLQTYHWAIGQENLIFLNCAISENEETRKFYTVRRNSNMPIWTQGLSSFNIDTILKHANEIPEIADSIVENLVECTSFESLTERYNISRIDLIQIDTEGYDYEIVKTLKLDNFKPSIINYENKHISMKKQHELISYLSSYGYKMYCNGHDTLAYLGCMNSL
jgi:FkbM family methyltransferase